MAEPRRALGRERALTIAVVTYRRPGRLAGLLAVATKEASSLVADGWRPTIAVVDNCPAGSARPAVEGSRGPARALRVSVEYHHEPTPGISAARNRALEVAAASDTLVFVDDDGLPASGWLRSLIEARERYAAAGVVGRMVPVYDATPLPWIEQGGFFVRPSRPTGTELNGGATNNLLLDLAAVRARDLRFDEDLGLIGGEDSLFTRRLVAEGGRFVWCDEAVVYDRVPAAKMTRRWVLLRRFRVSAGNVFVALRLADGRVARSRIRVRSLAAAGLDGLRGACGWICGVLLRSVATRARATARLATAVGRVAGLLGVHYREYARAGEPVTARLRVVPRKDARLVVLQSFIAPHERSNPYTVQLVDVLRRHLEVRHFSWRGAIFGRYDVFHLHWPEVKVGGRTRWRSAVRTAAFATLLVRLRLGRSVLVRTLHDRAPHEPPNRLQRAVLRLADRWTNSWILLHDGTPAPRPGHTTVVPLGDERRLLPGPRVDRVPGRLLHFGLVRPYKGVELLVDAFSDVEDPRVTLRVVGPATDDRLERRLVQSAAGDDRVVRVARHVSEAELRREVLQSELVVLPFREVTNSSSAIMALSLGRPILVPDIPAMRELRAEVGPSWVHLHEGLLTGDVLARTLSSARATCETDLPDLSSRSWERVGELHVAAYRAALRPERRGRGRVRRRTSVEDLSLPREVQQATASASSGVIR